MKKHLANRTNLFEELLNFPVFCEVASGLRLRSYQQAAGEAILDAILEQLGRTLVVIFPRQSGKNELQAQLKCYLLACLHTKESEVIKISPTYQPANGECHAAAGARTGTQCCDPADRLEEREWVYVPGGQSADHLPERIAKGQHRRGDGFDLAGSGRSAGRGYCEV